MSQAGQKEKRRRGYASWEFGDEQPSQSQPAAQASQAPGEMPSQSQGLRVAAEAAVSATPADAPSSQQAASSEHAPSHSVDADMLQPSQQALQAATTQAVHLSELEHELVLHGWLSFGQYLKHSTRVATYARFAASGLQTVRDMLGSAAISAAWHTGNMSRLCMQHAHLA